MFESFGRSWEITKMTFSVINKDRELFLFPILAGFFSLVFLLTMLFPTVITAILAETFSVDAVLYGILFLCYLGLAVIATFFNVCVVYTAKVRFGGGDATFMESIKFAFTRLRVIFLWGLLSATVGIVLAIIQNQSKKRNSFLGAMLGKILGGVWSIITLFVVPGLVYHNLTPIAAIKRSIQTLKKTWGESLIRHFGLGAIQGLVFFLSIIVFFGVLMFSIMVSVYLAIATVVLFGLFLLFWFLVFNLANTIFNVALFEYAEHGKIPAGFDKEHLQGAFRTK